MEYTGEGGVEGFFFLSKQGVKESFYASRIRMWVLLWVSFIYHIFEMYFSKIKFAKAIAILDWSGIENTKKQKIHLNKLHEIFLKYTIKTIYLKLVLQNFRVLQ